jgi:hypothetical protein
LVVLTDLADIIPTKQWGAVAKWGFEFSEAMRAQRTGGFVVHPFIYLTEIVRYAEPDSIIWDTLHPELLKMANSPLNWLHDNGRLMGAWLANAPVDYAKAVGLAMLAVQTANPYERSRRLNLLHGTEKARPDLKGAFTPELRTLATSPLEVISLYDAVEPEERAQAKIYVKQAISNAVIQAIPAPGTKTNSFGELPFINVIEWVEDDLAVVKQVISAVENSAVQTQYVPQLLSCIEILVLRGPRSFAEHILLHFETWVEHSPIGRNPMEGLSGPFSVMQLNDASLPEISKMLGWIGFQLLFKLGDPVAPVLAKWLHNSVLNPELTAIPIMIYVGIPAAIRLPIVSRIDLLSACQGLLAHLILRHRNEPEYDQTLALALGYLCKLMCKQDNPLVQWDSETAQQSLELSLPKLFLALSEASRSTNPDVRAEVARFLRNLEEWKKLTPTLCQILGKLRTDNRARVRFQARSRTRAVC